VKEYALYNLLVFRK